MKQLKKKTKERIKQTRFRSDMPSRFELCAPVYSYKERKKAQIDSIASFCLDVLTPNYIDVFEVILIYRN